ncbi:MAG: DUF4298 domain-containing protein [Gammaproteobacteria bacterium]|nr:DUF4298 domain-containing protein [Gammaproteobacteria bacterium]
MNRIEKAQQLLEQSERDLARMRQVTEELKKIEENRIALAHYYSEEYVKDYEEYEHQSHRPNVLDQDSIWNVLEEQNQEKIILLKTITNSL